MQALGIYISVPFCRAKCTYCNFASGVFSVAHHERYIGTVLHQVRRARQAALKIGAEMPEMVDSIYLGGGTPSILSPRLVTQLFREIREHFEVSPKAEITVECAPGQMEDDVLEAMLQSGVNRISFGVQSFVDQEAQAAGRLHTRVAALADIARVRTRGMSSINVDLIAGLPHQTATSWKESLDLLADSGADHASVYMLEVDEDSRLGREILDGGARYHASAVPSDELIADMYVEAIDRLSAAGLPQYEISNFAAVGQTSAHNLKYWLRHPYLGFGLDAHSMLATVEGDAVRFQTRDEMEPFLGDPTWQEIKVLTAEKRCEEAWFLGLRLNQGIDLEELAREFGPKPVADSQVTIAELSKAGLLQKRGQKVALTLRGRLLSNEVFANFLNNGLESEPELIEVL